MTGTPRTTPSPSTLPSPRRRTFKKKEPRRRGEISETINSVKL
jgi:hypothetical protein